MHKLGSRRGLETDPSGRWDIAVVRVEPQIRFTKYVQPINLPRCNEDPWYRKLHHNCAFSRPFPVDASTKCDTDL